MTTTLLSTVAFATNAPADRENGAPVVDANANPQTNLSPVQTPVTVPGIVDEVKCTPSVADTVKVDNGQAAAPTEEAVDVSSDLKVIAKTDHLADKQLNYTVDANYPQLIGAPLPSSAVTFNKAILSMVKSEIEQFKNSVKLNAAHMKTVPVAMQKNTLKVDYDVDVIKPRNEALISVRLTFEGIQPWRAHPYHNNRVINFDLKSGKVLSLADLFKKKSKYLQVISAYSGQSLAGKLKNNSWMVAQGTKADPKNFKNWNLQADSLLITFDEYQVAPYVFGQQEVEVPYSELKKILAAKTPIAECARDSRACQAVS